MANQIGRGIITGFAGTAVMTWPNGDTLSGTITRNTESLEVTAGGNLREQENSANEVSSLLGSRDYLECSWNFVPDGATIAAAVISGSVPQAGAGVAISGFPVIKMGPFSDGLNTNSGNTQPWIVQPGARIVGSKEGPWAVQFTARRYIGITSATPITS